MKDIKWVLKPGTFERQNKGVKQPGLDLTRATFDILKKQGMVVTNDCCSYFPTFPDLTSKVADPGNVSNSEISDLPIGAIFITWISNSTFYIWIKDKNEGSQLIVSND